MNAQREECSSERQQDTACPWNICGPSHASRDGAETCLCQKACHDSPITGRQALRATDGKKVEGNFFFKGRVEKVFIRWAMGFRHNRHGKAYSLTV